MDPRIARLILAADDEHCLSEILIIASALEIQDPRERPHHKQQHADQQHAPFRSEESDFLSFLKLWISSTTRKRRSPRANFVDVAPRHFLSWNRMREWTETHRQLMRLANDAGLKCYPRQNHGPSIHKALLAGFPFGRRLPFGGQRVYRGRGDQILSLPSSGLFKKKPSWCLTAECWKRPSASEGRSPTSTPAGSSRGRPSGTPFP